MSPDTAALLAIAMYVAAMIVLWCWVGWLACRWRGLAVAVYFITVFGLLMYGTGAFR